MSLTLRRLKHFQIVVAEGSFSAAARRLNIAQPALSHSIRTLEEHLGVRLLERSARGVIPTADGRSALLHCNRVLRSFAALEEDFKARKSEPSGKITLALAVTLARQMTPRLLQRLSKRYPNLEVNIIVVSSADALALMEQRKVELAVIPILTPMSQFSIRPIYREKVSLIQLSKSTQPNLTPIRFQDLANIPLVQTSPKYDLRRRIDQIAIEQGIEVKTKFEQNVSEVMLSITLAGLAAIPTQVSVFHPTLERPLLDIQQIIEPEIVRTHAVLRSAAQLHSLAERALEAEIENTLNDLVTSGGFVGEVLESRLAL